MLGDLRWLFENVISIAISHYWFAPRKRDGLERYGMRANLRVSPILTISIPVPLSFFKCSLWKMRGPPWNTRNNYPRKIQSRVNDCSWSRSLKEGDCSFLRTSFNCEIEAKAFYFSFLHIISSSNPEFLQLETLVLPLVLKITRIKLS